MDKKSKIIEFLDDFCGADIELDEFAELIMRLYDWTFVGDGLPDSDCECIITDSYGNNRIAKYKQTEKKFYWTPEDSGGCYYPEEINAIDWQKIEKRVSGSSAS